jgi:hypothetical protein
MSQMVRRKLSTMSRGKDEQEDKKEDDNGGKMRRNRGKEDDNGQKMKRSRGNDEIQVGRKLKTVIR